MQTEVLHELLYPDDKSKESSSERAMQEYLADRVSKASHDYDLKISTKNWGTKNVPASSSPGPGNTIRGKPQFPGPAHNNTGLWYFFPRERLGKFSVEILMAVSYLCQ